MRGRDRIALALVLGLVAIAIAGCGDGDEQSPEPTTPDSIDPDRIAEFRECMSEHGVEPPEGGRGAGLGPGRPPVADFQNALEACRDLAPGPMLFGEPPPGG